MIVLGLSQVSPHDPSAALLVDGRVAACIEQERLSREKHAWGELATDAARACLEIAGVDIAEVDRIAVPYSLENLKKLRFQYFRRSLGRRGSKAWKALFPSRKRLRRALGDARASIRDLGGDPAKIPIHNVEHHFAHAASSFFFSGMESAALLTIDGEGECTTTLFGEADRERGVRAHHEIARPDSLGIFYSNMTQYLGFRPDDGEYKLMGMAPYGEPDRCDLSDIVRFGNGDYRIDLGYVHSSRKLRYEGKRFSGRLVERLGPPRQGDALAEPYVHVAAATQKLLEDASLHLVESRLGDALRRHEGRLCFAGGCALNVVLNRKLIHHPLVRELFVQPAAGDAGLSLGAAAHVAHDAGDAIAPMRDPYHGPEYGSEQVAKALGGTGLASAGVADPAERAAQLLHAGHVVAWFQGRMEWGPRALGNRSILGNPAVRGTADRINEQIKFREVWRPFCPSILEEHAPEVLDIEHDSPFMTFSFEVRKEWRERIPEVVHVDGTARPQLVSRSANPLFHRLLEHFHALSGCPLVINTSLNRRGEPMVCSPEDAVAMFRGSGLTHMLLGDVLVVKPGFERDLRR